MTAGRYDADAVRRLVASGRLTRWQVYALEHQHPLNQLSHAVGIPLILFACAWPVWTLAREGALGWRVWLAGNVVGWAFQLAGHAVEGNRPAFVSDPLHLLIGPLHFAAKPARWLRGRPDVVIDPEVLRACAVPGEVPGAPRPAPPRP